MVFLLGTLLSDVKTNGVVNRLGFSLFFYIPLYSKWGGLLLMWHLGLDVEPIYISSNVMAIFLYSNPAHLPWLFVLMYCLAQQSQKDSF